MPARILIVEDEALVAMELGLLLEDAGHEIAAFATDSRAALQEADRGRIDLALVDVHLADGATGPRLGARLARQGVQVLFITGNPAMVAREGRGCVGALAKPADERVIQNAVGYALARREGQLVSPPPQLHLLS